MPEIDLGAVSAYALAVKHGYVGTEEEWAAEQVKAGENARLAREASDAASAAAKNAAAVAVDIADKSNQIEVNKTDVGKLKHDFITIAETGFIPKNEFTMPYYDQSASFGGISFTANADGSIVANGTPVSNGYFYLVKHQQMPSGSRFRLAGCPSGGSSNTYSIRVGKSKEDLSDWDTIANETGNGIELEFLEQEKYCIMVSVKKGITVNNMVFYPVLMNTDMKSNVELGRMARETSAAASAAADTAREATKLAGEALDTASAAVSAVENVEIEMANQSNQIDLNKADVSQLKNHFYYISEKGFILKNELAMPYFDKTASFWGISFTVNEDGSVVANGTPVSNGYFYFVKHQKMPSGKKFRLTGCPAGGSANTYSIRVGKSNAGLTDWETIANDIGNGVELEFDEHEKYCIMISIKGGYTVDQLVFQPELIDAEMKSNIELACMTKEASDAAEAASKVAEEAFDRTSTVANAVENIEAEMEGHSNQIDVNTTGLSRLKNDFSYITDKGFVPKNELTMPYFDKSASFWGISFTANADGSIVADGTPASNGYFYLVKHQEMPSGKKFRLTGCPAGGSANTYSIRVGKSNAGLTDWTTFANDIGDGVELEFAENEKYCIMISIKGGFTADNIVFHPRLTDTTIKSNVELEKIARAASEAANTAVRDASEIAVEMEENKTDVSRLMDDFRSIAEQGYIPKNELMMPYFDKTASFGGISFTLNEDGSITASGTPASNAYFYLVKHQQMPSGKKFRLTGCPSGGSSNTYSLRVGKSNAGLTDWSTITNDTGNGVELEFSENEKYCIMVSIRQGIKVENLTFHPVLLDVNMESNAELGRIAKPLSDAFDIVLSGNKTLSANGEMLRFYPDPDKEYTCYILNQGYTFDVYEFYKNGSYTTLESKRSAPYLFNYKAAGSDVSYIRFYNKSGALTVNTSVLVTESNHDVLYIAGKTEENNKLYDFLFSNEFCAVQKYTVIGDSMASGYYQLTSDTVTQHDRNLDYSWVQILARMNGQKAENATKSGITCDGWWLDADGCCKAHVTASNQSQVYIVGLGTNDYKDAASPTASQIGSIDDIDGSNYNNNGNSFWGNYAKILQYVHEVAPLAQIICFTIPNPRPETAWKEQAIRDITALPMFADYVSLCDLVLEYRDMIDNDVLKAHYLQGHFSPVGYANSAKFLNYALSKTIRKNKTKFLTLPQIPFDI